MKLKRALKQMLSLLILLGLLTGCGSGPGEQAAKGSQQTSPRESGEPRPDDEYARAIWYGFLPDELVESEPEDTVVTWGQYCSMLGKAIRMHDEDAYSKWKK